MNRDELLEQIKHAVHEVEPDAEIILYGSRSRGEALAESDWDLLILLRRVIEERLDEIKSTWDAHFRH